mgnify:CR=1 FL=1
MKRGNRRRGVLLLVIMGLLAMFGMVLIAFVMVAGQHSRASRSHARIDMELETPQKLVDQAVRQLIRGTNNAMSAVGPHSLLEDLYGQPSGVLQLSDAAVPLSGLGPVTDGGQLFGFDVPSIAARPSPYHYLGCVMTMLTGQAAGRSTHIVGLNSDGTKLQAVSFDEGQPANGDYYIVNLPAFSGTGAGYKPTTGNLDLTVGSYETALLPNVVKASIGAVDPTLGGVNEDYDAADFQNMFLGTPPVPSSSSPMGFRLTPSFHRPDLIAYWTRRVGTTNGTDFIRNGPIDLVRSVLLRPAPADHPFFPGNPASGTPAFDPINGPWDVDNDGDGIADSIWIDLGLPVRSTPDGRKYKPLFAIYCLDMDGRLNLNVHGSMAQTSADYYAPVQATAELPVPLNVARFADGAAGQAQHNLPRGLGMGPADVNLLPLFVGAGGVDPLTMYQAVLGGMTTAQLDGRWGDYALADHGQTPRPGILANDSQLDSSITNLLYYSRWANYAGNYWGYITGTDYQLDAFGSPPDLVAAGAIGLDVAGRPIYSSLGRDFHLPDVPYKINVGRDAPRGASTPAAANVPDNLFGYGELERLLRPFDRDNPSLPGRLVGLSWLGDSSWLMQRRHLLTTESWDLTAPNLALTPEMRTALGGSGQRAIHPVDLLRAKNIAPQYWRQLLPAELLRGERLDLNRWFGNGRDDTGDGVVDDPAEALGGEQLAVFGPGEPNAVPFDHINRRSGEAVNAFPGTDSVTGQPYTARQLQARYLYVLACLLADMDHLAIVFDDGAGNGRKLACRHLAQWAVNVVDFYDRDSIMTRFPFALDTDFRNNGWNPPNDPSMVVWGCERPELLLTEAIACHDRRTKDTAEELPNGKTTTHDNGPGNPRGETDGTNDFDQKKKPVPSLFFELFNPWSDFEAPSGEFRKDRRPSGSGQWAAGVLLNQQVKSNGDPVWRVVVASPRDESEEQPDPDHYDANQRPEKIYASIYFVDLATASGFADPDAGSQGYLQFYPSANWSNKIAPLLPGRYAVVGPNSIDSAFASQPEQPTWIGEKTTMSDWPTDRQQIRRIVLRPDANPASGNQVEVRDNRNGAQPDQQGIPMQNAVAVVVDKSNPPDRRLGLTAPTKKPYPNVDAAATPEVHTEAEGYKVPYDEPFDYSDPPSANEYHEEDVATVLAQDGTVAHFRVLHLQRLADPTLPFHPVTNPYRTIDSLPVDLTVFNGIKKPVDPVSGSEVVEPGISKGTTQFDCRQRGERNERSAGQFNIWKQEPIRKRIEAGAKTLTNHVFDYEFVHTLGYLNDGKTVNSVFGPPGATDPYRGDPQQPFPWFTWNNRPFFHPMELLLVPTVHSSKLLARRNEDSTVRDDRYYGYPHQNDPIDPYEADLKNAADRLPYPHLLNFFQSRLLAGGGRAMELHRLLEYVAVPSRFTGTTLRGRPDRMVDGDHWFHPPFHLLPTYREPGRVNLNTIYYPEVFFGLINEIPGRTAWNTFGDRNAQTMWEKFVRSRRGDGVSDDLLRPNTNDLPAATARPFRSFAGAYNVPIDSLRPRREIDATTLRADPDEATRPLFERRSTNPAENANRNPFFRYQGLGKIASCATTRSNVFAVWITVGYFEVYPRAKDAGHPDGWEIRGELGSDTGEIQRHRAFYLIDRSLPAGFFRGEDLNIENLILIRRFIE